MRDAIIIIPAYNEEGSINGVLRDIQEHNIPADVVVINDGSSDGTEALAKRNNVIVIRHPYNLGYGAALQTGFKYAVEHGYEYAVQFDADGQHDPAFIDNILNKLKNKHADIVIGSRFLGESSMKTGLAKRLVIRMFSFIIKFLTGYKITDPTSGFKGLSRRLFTQYSLMGSFPEDFPDADILIQTIRNHYKAIEIPVTMHNRLTGTGMHDGFSFKQLYYLCKIFLSIIIVLMRGKTAVKEDETFGEPC